MSNTTDQNVQEALSLLESKLNEESPLNQRAFLRACSVVLGMQKSELAIDIEKSAKNSIAASADMGGLIRIGNGYGIAPEAATFNVSNIKAPGTVGETYNQGTVWQTPDDFRYFQNASAVVQADGFAYFAVQSQFTGSDYNLNDGDELTTEIDAEEITAVVVSTATKGLNEETTENFRIRVLTLERSQGGGSNLADLRSWGQSPLGVKQVYPYSGSEPWTDSEPGERTVYVESTDDYGLNGIADASLLDQVFESIKFDANGRARQAAGSVDSLLYVKSITKKTLRVKINGIPFGDIDDLTSQRVQEKINTVLEEESNAVEPAVPGLTTEVEDNSKITSVTLGRSIQNVLDSFSIVSTKVTLLNEYDVGLNDYQLNPGEKAILEAVYG